MNDSRVLDDGSRPPFEVPAFEDELVFVVDDDQALADGLDRFLTRSGFNVNAFTDPKAALEALDRRLPRVVVADKEMPGMSGIELAERMLERDPSIRVIVMTGAGGEASAQAALRVGADDYFTKPLDLTELARSVQRSLTSYAADDYARCVSAWFRDEVARQSAKGSEIMLGTLAALVNALEARSPHFRGHSHRVAECAVKIARAIGSSDAEVETVHAAGLLHDVGMIAVPDSIVQKPSFLDPEEMEVVREHCRTGAEILEPITHLGPAIRFVLEHHERLDGSGYPDGKRGAKISTGGQIIGLAEAWTALSEARNYRGRMDRSEARAALVAASGTWFSEDLVRALFAP